MDPLRIVVTGLIGSIPLAGLTFHYLQYVLGLARLGHDVLYLEDTGTWYYDPRRDQMVDDVNLPTEYLRGIMRRFDLADRWSLVDHRDRVHGIDGTRLEKFLQTADLLINVTGAGLMRESYLTIPHRAYIDTDPGFVQFRLADGSATDHEHLARHTTHFSFGCNLGQPSCRVPGGGFTWIPTVQPVCLDLWWSADVPPPEAPFTTVMKWKSYDPVEHDGERYGLKDMEFAPYLDLPRRTTQSLELAIAGRPPGDRLRAGGWRCRSGLEISSDIDSYLRYLQGSRGEWSVAKHAYVATRSGWFSERTACYLASGRPAVVQDTGFGDWLDGTGAVFAFSDPEQALAGIETARTDFSRRRRRAREVAAAHFNAPDVLASLVDRCLNADQ